MLPFLLPNLLGRSVTGTEINGGGGGGGGGGGDSGDGGGVGGCGVEVGGGQKSKIKVRTIFFKLHPPKKMP